MSPISKSIQDYREKILAFVSNSLPNPIQVFTYLLEDYVKTEQVILPFVMRIKKELKSNQIDYVKLINELDTYLHHRSNTAYKYYHGHDDKFYALLTAYFYYYFDFYQMHVGVLETNKCVHLKKQLLYPLAIYKKNIDKDKITDILQMLNNDDYHVRAAACNALGTMPIFADRQEAVIGKLLHCLDDNIDLVSAAACTALAKLGKQAGENKPLIEAPLLQVSKLSWTLHYVLCKSLGWVGMSVSTRYLVIERLLEKCDSTSFEVVEAACKALGIINIPDNLQDPVIDKLLKKLKHNYSTINDSAAKALMNISIPTNQINNIIQALLHLIQCESNVTAGRALASICKSHNQLENMHINLLHQYQEGCKKHGRDSIAECRKVIIAFSVIKILPRYRKAVAEILIKNLDANERSIVSYACAALANISVPVGMRHTAIKKLLPLINSYDNLSDLKALAVMKIPEDMKESVVNALLGISIWENNLTIMGDILSKINLTAHQQDLIIQKLYNLENNNNPKKMLNACQLLNKMPISDSMRETLLIKILELIWKKANSWQTAAICQCAHEVLSEFKVPVPYQKMVVESVLNNAKNSDNYNTKVEALRTLAQLEIPTNMHMVVIKKLLGGINHENNTIADFARTVLMHLAKQLTLEELNIVYVQLEVLTNNTNSLQRQLEWKTFAEQFRLAYLVPEKMIQEISAKTNELPNEMWHAVYRYV